MSTMKTQKKLDIATLIWNNIAQPKHRFIVRLAEYIGEAAHAGQTDGDE